MGKGYGQGQGQEERGEDPEVHVVAWKRIFQEWDWEVVFGGWKEKELEEDGVLVGSKKRVKASDVWVVVVVVVVVVYAVLRRPRHWNRRRTEDPCCLFSTLLPTFCFFSLPEFLAPGFDSLLLKNKKPKICISPHSH